MTTKFTDAAPISGTRRTEDGYLIAEARSVRTGIQLYRGSEVGKADMETVRVYRPPEEVFAQDSLQSFSHAPVTIDHPSEAVTGDNWKRLAAGEVSTAAKQDGEWIMLPLILKDAAAIKAVEDGKRELSAGYSCQLDWTPGTSPEGQEYDAVQRGIRINHLAVVDKARAGSRARIGDDANWGASPVTPKADERNPHMPDNLQTVVVDGLNVSTTDQGAQAIKKLISDRDTAQKALSDAKADHAKALADKDTELGKKDAEIEDLKSKQFDDAKLDQMVADRADIVAKVKAIAPSLKTDNVSNADLKKQAVAAKLGDEKVKDKSDDYVAGLFDHLTADAKPRNPLSDGIQDSKVVVLSDWGDDVFARAGVNAKKGA
ncbi:DUF2213 domain-containing protein [Henriciella mobilis]|uniref:DUF2213 domain-containing protein n=1 Tax=Henriciella mobilis TaxID=2305467 RepID=UPI000E674EA1|nr:DUF2213 domain-containing protein [Henriciella mobilis]RIJ15957.1 DUF2213 domain-containing protein [Henriciella mobilis]RIJ21167.1 DUF2213 domain-containing protein [Henriciella mobilis]RIJ23132.1 DUF2213 domain-containing protein [Henriciella mobilis]